MASSHVPGASALRPASTPRGSDQDVAELEHFVRGRVELESDGEQRRLEELIAEARGLLEQLVGTRAP